MGDYLRSDKILARKGLVDAINIAPQFGVLQTLFTIQKCVLYGVDYSKFLDDAYKSEKWIKWLSENDYNNKFLCSVVAGHYVFSKKSYKTIFNEISKYTNFKEDIINEVIKNISYYSDRL